MVPRCHRLVAPPRLLLTDELFGRVGRTVGSIARDAPHPQGPCLRPGRPRVRDRAPPRWGGRLRGVPVPRVPLRRAHGGLRSVRRFEPRHRWGHTGTTDSVTQPVGRPLIAQAVGLSRMQRTLLQRCGAILQSPVGNLESVISNRPSTIRNSQSTVGSLVLTYCYVSRRAQIPTPLRPRSSGYIWTGAGIGRRTSRRPNADGTRLHRPQRRRCGHLARHPRARRWGSRLGLRCGRLTMRSANTRGMRVAIYARDRC